jgi:Ran GTPase-activating protein (RanGAP) involved in mRNA processing and transport
MYLLELVALACAVLAALAPARRWLVQAWTYVGKWFLPPARRSGVVRPRPREPEPPCLGLVAEIERGTDQLDIPDCPISDGELRSVFDTLRDADSAQRSPGWQLGTLSVMRNPLAINDTARLAEALAANRALTVLNLSYTGMGPEGAAWLAAALARNGTLRVLKLDNNSLGPEGAEFLSRGLAESGFGVRRSLRTLDLEANEIGDGGARALASALRLSGIQTLNLRLNDIGPTGAASLSDALHLSLDRDSHSLLAHLSLQDNQIGDDGAASLAAALAGNRTLRELDLRDNGIGNAGAAALASVGLAANSALASLRLERNCIGDDGAVALATVLVGTRSSSSSSRSSSGIRSANSTGSTVIRGSASSSTQQAQPLSLFLQSNGGIGPVGISALGGALGSAIAELDLNFVNGGDAGALELACRLLKFTATPSRLAALHLCGQGVGDVGATALVAAIASSAPRLRRLSLGQNDIGDRGARALAGLLTRRPCSLTAVDLSGNMIGDAGGADFALMLETNRTLRELDLRYNSIRSASASALGRALLQNTTLRTLRLEENGAAATLMFAAAVAGRAAVRLPLAAEQRLALLVGYIIRRKGRHLPIHRLPLDILRRILTAYDV